jgi:hypothetical protein
LKDEPKVDALHGHFFENNNSQRIGYKYYLILLFLMVFILFHNNRGGWDSAGLGYCVGGVSGGG